LLIAFLITAAIVIVIIKWLLITIAILIVSLGAWYLWDRAQQRRHSDHSSINTFG
jgi:membrane protein implicated in regulation of membrane protease activity